MKKRFDFKKSVLAIVMLFSMLLSNASCFAVTADGELAKDTLYTVTFDAVLPAKNTPDSVTVLSGAQAQIPANTPEYSGWAFIGWNESGSALDSYYIPGQYISVTGDVTLKAVWKTSDEDGKYPTGGFYSVYYSANGGIWAEGDDTPYRKPTDNFGLMSFGMHFAFPAETSTLAREGYRLETDVDDMTVPVFYSGNGKGDTTYNDPAVNNGYEYEIYANAYKSSVFMVDTDRVAYGTNVFVYAAWDPIIKYNMNDGTGTIIQDFNYVTDGDDYTILGSGDYTAYSSSSSVNGRAADENNTLLANREGYNGATQITSKIGYIIASWNTAEDGSGESYSVNEVYDITEPLTLYAQWEADPDHVHEYDVVVVKEATCTARGRIEYTCACGDFYYERPLALGHDYSAWVVDTANSEQTRVCYRCDTVETVAVVLENIPAVVVNGYEFEVTNTENIASITYAAGKYDSEKDVAAASDAVTLNEGEFSATAPAVGIYTVMVTLNDSSVYLLTADLSNAEPSLTAYGVTLTLNDLEGVKDFFISKGDCNSYSEVKVNRVVNVTYKKFVNNSYTYVLTTPGFYTVYIRYNDASIAAKSIKVNVTVDEPVFTSNGLQLHIDNIDEVKVIRTAYGEYASPSAIKKAEGSRAFTSKTVLKDVSEYTIQYRENGVATVAVCYNNGYVKIYSFEVKKLVPEFVQDNDTVTIGNLDNLQVIRYAMGEYTGASEIKNAPDCVQFTKADIVDGKIVITELEVGVYTFLVQYKDESYNFYTIEVEPKEPTASGISISNAFSSNMIIQRDEKFTVWGGGVTEANEGKTVMVTFKGETAVGVVENGIWEAVFDCTFPVDTEGSDLVVRAADGQVTFSDVLVGDVYYVVGQSNVYYSMGDLIVDLNTQGQLSTLDVDYNDARDIRFYRISSTHYQNNTGTMAQGTPTLYEDVYNGAYWMKPSDVYAKIEQYAMPFVLTGKANDNVTCGLHTFSALGYMFAYNMSNRSDVPVGIIEIDASGYPLITFAPNELASSWGKEGYDAATDTYYFSSGSVVAPQLKSRFAYNQQIYPLHRFSIAGIVWYQGESDFPNTDEYLGAGAKSFQEEFAELMTYFRNDFGNSDFPVYMIEFAPAFAGLFNAYMDFGSSRAEEGMVPSILEDCYVVSTSDLWKNTMWANNVHPPIKHLNAYRLTDIVMADKFGEGNIDDVCGPTVETVEYSGNTVTITFDHVSTGLKAAGGSSTVIGVEVLVNGSWVAMSGDFIRNGNQLVITASSTISGVRYNRNTSHTFPEYINLCNGYNMPAVAFVDYK